MKDEVADRLDEGWSVQEIADWAGCSVRSVRNVAMAGRIELPQARRRAARLAVLHNSDALRAEFAAGASVSAIAKRLSLPPAQVRGTLEGLGLAISNARARAHPQLYEPGWLAKRLRARRSLPQIASEVGCSTTAVRAAIRSLGITARRGYAERRFPHLHDPAWLHRRYVDEGLTAAALAAEIGCRAPSVLKALHRYGVNVRPGGPPRRYPQLHDHAWLLRRHDHEAQSVGAIAVEVGCSVSSVRRAMRRYGIAARGRPRTRIDRLHDAAWLRRRYIGDNASVRNVADEIGCAPSSVRGALQVAEIRLRRAPRRS